MAADPTTDTTQPVPTHPNRFGHVLVGGNWWPVHYGPNGSRSRLWPVKCFASDATVPRFVAGQGFNKSRTRKVRSVVAHWTAGEGGALQVARTLLARKLGIPWVIDGDGTIWQFCDPADVACAHAGEVNPWTDGIEIVNYGYAAQWRAISRVLKVPIVPKAGKDRETYMAVTHGKVVRTARFRPLQLDALCALCDTLAQAHGIPRTVSPVIDGVLPSFRDFTGFMGHLNITTGKRDPGPEPLLRLRAHFDQTPTERRIV